MLDEVLTTRYVTPLREGGSLPGIVEAADLGTYVMKFRGAGQGTKALVAEVVVHGLARRLGVRVPDIVALELDPAIARYEADQEVQDLLNASIGRNLGVDFLPGALGYDGKSFAVDPDDAARILWLDAFVANVDRSWQNPNLLVWHRTLWCIDHGAALYFHHNWTTAADVVPDRFAVQPYAFDKHIMNAHADRLPGADSELAPQVTRQLLTEVLDDVPESWLDVRDVEPTTVRGWYVDYLLARATTPRVWLKAS